MAAMNKSLAQMNKSWGAQPEVVVGVSSVKGTVCFSHLTMALCTPFVCNNHYSGATALALVLGLVMIVGRSVWRYFAKPSMWEPTRTEALAGKMSRAYSSGCLAQTNKSLA
jgi:hypothetical protein